MKVEGAVEPRTKPCGKALFQLTLVKGGAADELLQRRFTMQPGLLGTLATLLQPLSDGAFARELSLSAL